MSIATYDDEKSERVLAAISRKTRPYRERDIAMAARLSLAPVRLRLRHLKAAGLVDEHWRGMNGPFWELAK